MSHISSIGGNLNALDAKFCILAARFNSFIVERLVEGAIDALVRHGIERDNIEIVRVPGAYEMPILRTKLYIPPVRDGLVARPRLIDRLNHGLRLDVRLTLVSAPAGFGKTTLVSDWISKTGRPAGWLTLDGSDNDPRRFLMYVVAALRVIDAEIGQGLIDAVQSTQPLPVESVLLTL